MNEIRIVEVKSCKDRHDFVNFPLKLYKTCEFFVPPLYGDEMALFKKKNAYSSTCESVFFLAKRGKEVVGRIQGILQHQSNEIRNEKRVRFTRFDSVNEQAVATALFEALENWAREKGMDTMCGPLGYNDLEREGLLIEGFGEMSTFEEQYSYSYYPQLIEACGYEKEIDWLESQIRAPKTKNDMLKRVAQRAMEINKLHVVDPTKYTKRQYINKYKEGVFECIDRCYSHLYGTVPMTEESKKQIVDQFIMILNPKYLIIICDENEKVVSFALCLPAIGGALQKSGGRLTIPALIRLFKAIKNPRVVDLALIGVLPEYQATGINAVMLDKMTEYLENGEVDYFETNLNLETNVQVMSQWKYFDARQHKRRRSYKKGL
ncbi:MAG: hypothetical protein IJ309_01400 [Clostridia bacterium]|nr:hypothetical protein [Clostridia bacterium]